jgi:hypothetical protein
MTRAAREAWEDLERAARGDAATKIEMYLPPELSHAVEAYRRREEEARRGDVRFASGAKHFSTEAAVINLLSIGIQTARRTGREAAMNVGLPPGTRSLIVE